MTDDEVGAKPFGIPIKAKGVNAIALTIMAVAIGGCMFLLWDSTKRSESHLDSISQSHAIARDRQTQQMATEHTAIVEALKGVREANESISAGITEQNFIILSDEREKQDIKKNYRMPESLRRKLGR